MTKQTVLQAEKARTEARQAYDAAGRARTEARRAYDAAKQQGETL